MPIYDTLIRGGTIVDGLRTPRYTADLAISKGQIAAIGRIDASQAEEVIDADGLIVAPGFVDLHTHYDSQVYWDPYCTISGWHGVTSAVIGNCGFGFAPVKPEDRDRAMLTMSRNEAVPLESMQAGMPWDWETYPEFLDSLDRTPKGINLMSYMPLNPLLMYVMGLDAAKSRPASGNEMQRMQSLMREGLAAGGCGWSAQLGTEAEVQRDYDGSFMITNTMAEEDLGHFRAGVLWAIGRLGEVVEKDVDMVLSSIVASLDDPDPQIRGLATWCLGQVGRSAQLDNRQDLLTDEGETVLYREGELARLSVGRILREALALGDEPS